MFVRQIIMNLAGALRACAALCGVLTLAILVNAQQTNPTLTEQQQRTNTTPTQPPTATSPAQTEPAQTQQQQPTNAQQQSTQQPQQQTQQPTTQTELQSVPAHSTTISTSTPTTARTQSIGMQSGMGVSDIVETAVKAGNFNTQWAMIRRTVLNL